MAMQTLYRHIIGKIDLQLDSENFEADKADSIRDEKHLLEQSWTFTISLRNRQKNKVILIKKNVHIWPVLYLLAFLKEWKKHQRKTSIRRITRLWS